MMLALWNCISIPFIVAFTPDSANDESVFVVSAIIDAIFFVDVILNFRTTYFSSSTGDEIKDVYKIARKYLFGGRFVVDILASIPLDLILDPIRNDGTELNLFGLLKLVRILRLSRIISYMRARDEIKMVFKLMQLMLFLYMYVHLIACLWFFSIN